MQDLISGGLDTMLVLVQDGEPIRGALGSAESGEAEGTGADGTGGGGAAQSPSSPFGNMFLLLMLGVLVLMIWGQISGARRERKRKQEMLVGLRKHDTVLTKGGVKGKIVEIKGEDVTIRSGDTRFVVVKDAVVGVTHAASTSASDDPAEEEQAA